MAKRRESYAARMRRIRAAEAGVDYEYYTKQQLVKLYGKKCYLCGRLINRRLRWPNPFSFSIDHVTPISAGGHDTIDNVRPTHLRCNLSKGTKILPR